MRVGLLLNRSYRNRILRPAIRRARQVDAPIRFAVRELKKSRLMATYRLRSSGMAVCVRHEGIDTFLLDEIFGDEIYRPTGEVETILARSEHPYVVDLGANIGLFGVYVLSRWPHAEVVGFEPDPGNAAVHRACLEANGAPGNWRLIEAYAAASPGAVSFSAKHSPLSHVGSGADGDILVASVDVFGELAGADLLKMDIEGAEWPILLDDRFARARVPAIVLEYHRTGCPHPDARGYACELLSGSGYEVREIPGTMTGGAGILWAWQRDLPR